MVVLVLVLALLVVLEIDLLLLLLLLAFLRNACLLLVAIPSSEHDMAVLPVLVVQLLAVAKEKEEGAVSAVPEDRGVMTVHLGGVRHMGCGDVVVDQFRLGFIVIYSIFD